MIAEAVAGAVNNAVDVERERMATVYERAGALDSFGFRRGTLERWWAYVEAHASWVQARRALDVLERYAEAAGLELCEACHSGRYVLEPGGLYCSEHCERWDYMETAYCEHARHVAAGIPPMVGRVGTYG